MYIVSVESYCRDEGLFDSNILLILDNLEDISDYDYLLTEHKYKYCVYECIYVIIEMNENEFTEYSIDHEIFRGTLEKLELLIKQTIRYREHLISSAN